MLEIEKLMIYSSSIVISIINELITVQTKILVNSIRVKINLSQFSECSSI